MMNRCKNWMILIFPIVAALHVYVFMYLWNLLVTDIFSLREINFWESLGLVAMVKLLFMVGSGRSKCCCKSSCNSESVGFKSNLKEHFKSKYCK